MSMLQERRLKKPLEVVAENNRFIAKKETLIPLFYSVTDAEGAIVLKDVLDILRIAEKANVGLHTICEAMDCVYRKNLDERIKRSERAYEEAKKEEGKWNKST